MPWRASAAAPLLLAACSGGEGRLRAAPAHSGFQQTGIASWYGEELRGQPTASGERFDPAGLTAAHRTLPLGTMVEVTVLDTERAVAVRVNDRGPGRADRLIDLSQGAARLLGTDRRPLALAPVRVLAGGERAGLVSAGRPWTAPHAEPVAPGRYWLHVASFSSHDRARALAERLGGQVVTAGALYRVRVGPLNDARLAQREREIAVAQGYGDAYLSPFLD